MQRRVLIPSLVCQSPRHSPPSSWVCLARLSFHFLFICGPRLRASPDRSPSSLKSGTASRPKADDRLAVLILSLALTLPRPTPPPLPRNHLFQPPSLQHPRFNSPCVSLNLPPIPCPLGPPCVFPRPGLVDSVPLAARRREGETTNKKEEGRVWRSMGIGRLPFVPSVSSLCIELWASLSSLPHPTILPLSLPPSLSLPQRLSLASDRRAV